MVIFHGIYGGLMESNGIYHLVMINIAMVQMALIEIGGLPIKNCDFPWLWRK